MPVLGAHIGLPSLSHISLCLSGSSFSHHASGYVVFMSYSCMWLCRIHAPGYVVFGGCGGHLSMRGKVSDTHVDVGDT